MTLNRRPFMAEIQMAQRAKGGKLADILRTPAAVSQPAPQPAAGGAPVTFDDSRILRGIDAIEGKLDRILAVDAKQIDFIQTELADISGRIKATKSEIAALRHPLDNEDKFRMASEELTAVVASTETATHKIMGCAEGLDDIIHELRASMPEGSYSATRVHDMSDFVTRIYEACNFQDLTGQRITKVVRVLTYIEERVDNMMSLWGKKEFESMPLPPSVIKQDEAGMDLHGPAAAEANGNFSQDDIDALFG